MSSVLWLLAATLVCVPLVVQSWRSFGRVAALVGLAVVAIALGVPGLLLGRAAQNNSVPTNPQQIEYETSTSCEKCHADHYDSWHRTWHRTMTQEASPQSVLGDFDVGAVQLQGRECFLFRVAGRFFMDLPTPEWDAREPDRFDYPPRRQFEVHRVVGSHNMQVYLSRMPDGAYMTLPLIWHKGERRWVTEAGSFLRPEAKLYAATTEWNVHCAQCHNTKATPGFVYDGQLQQQRGIVWRTTLEEMGIACEACHGPGGRHSGANRNPARRAYLREVKCDDLTIVNPADLDKERSVEVCGRCHGKWTVKPQFEKEWHERGELFVPGWQRLQEHYRMPFRDTMKDYEAERIPKRNFYWPDWTPRASGMEYQGVILSPCYERGELTCLSCHSMHQADPDDQLKFSDKASTPVPQSNQACVQCHPQYSSPEQLADHTHHAATSEGSRCYNCHMPYQAYGLLKAIRNHRISSPNAETSANSGLPNACNQCHVDRSLLWTAETLADWYPGHDVPPMSEDEKSISATLVDLLQGHALSRALAAASLRRALEASSEVPSRARPAAWPVPFLTYALDDSYPAVRLLAYQALRQVPGFEDADYDYLATEQSRHKQIEAVRRRWSQFVQAVPSQPSSSAAHRTSWNGVGGTAIPLGPDGQPIDEIVQRLMKQQDPTELSIQE